MIRKFFEAYITTLLFAIICAFFTLLGAALMFAALTADLERRHVITHERVSRELMDAWLRQTGSRPSGCANLRCRSASRFDPARGG